MATVSSYNFKDDIFYVHQIQTVSRFTDVHLELTKDMQGNRPQYSMEAYSTSNRYNLKLQYPNNFVVPLYHNHLGITVLDSMLNKNPENDYAVIVETFTINTSLDAANLLDYYSTGNLRGIANTKQNADMCRLIRSKIQKGIYPIEAKIMHIIDLSKLKGLKSVYLPNLNLQLYISDMTRLDVHPLKHYVGDYAPKSAIKQDGVMKAMFRIVDNHNPGKVYYTKMFGEVYRINSISSLVERDSVRITIMADDLEIENKIIHNLHNLKEIGIYSSLIECENSDSLDNIIEVKKLELKLEEMHLSRSKATIEHNTSVQKHLLETSKIKFEYSKLETETFKNLVDLKVINFKIKELNLTKKMEKELNKKTSTPNSKITNTKGIIDIATGGLKLILNVIDLF